MASRYLSPARGAELHLWHGPRSLLFLPYIMISCQPAAVRIRHNSGVTYLNKKPDTCTCAPAQQLHNDLWGEPRIYMQRKQHSMRLAATYSAADQRNIPTSSLRVYLLHDMIWGKPCCSNLAGIIRTMLRLDGKPLLGTCEGRRTAFRAWSSIAAAHASRRGLFQDSSILAEIASVFLGFI